MKRILFKTTIPRAEDDWHVGRFSLLAQQLESLRDDRGDQTFSVTARDRTTDADGDDPDLVNLPDSHFDELWLFAVDVGAGLTTADADGIRRFTARGGGLLFTRDHHDLGACLLKLGEIGHAHFFNSVNREPDLSRHRVDDTYASTISFPNYHSGRNGDLQVIEPAGPVHALLRCRGSDSITRFPAHPHEGVVGVPVGDADVRASHRQGPQPCVRPGFQFDRGVRPGPHGWRRTGGCALILPPLRRLQLESTVGLSEFCDQPEGDQVMVDANALDDIHAYVGNLARWLARDPD